MIHHTDFETAYQPIYHQPQPQRKGLKPTHKGLVLWHVFLAFYYLCGRLCGASTVTSDHGILFDLSHVFDNTTIYWVTAKPLTLNVTYGIRSDTVWYQSDEFSAATHGGTHIDAPCHFAKGRWCVSDIPLERLVAKASVVDISHKVQNNPEIHLTKEDLLQWEKTNGQIAKDSLLLIRTGWARFWPDPETYSGTAQREVTLLRFPSILPEAAEWLVAERDIVGVGVDTMSVDVPGTVPRTHTTLMEKNIYGLENVNIPAGLPPTGATVFVMPMKLKYASGAPCRIVAQVAKGALSYAPCLVCSPSVVLTMVAVYICCLFWTKRFD